MIHLPLALKMAEQHHATKAAGLDDLFGMTDPEPKAAADWQMIPEDGEDWDDELRLQGEKATLGLYLTGHPIDRYEAELSGMGVSRIGKLSVESSGGGDNGYRRRGKQRVMVAGLALSVNHRQTQRGQMGTLVLDDRSGRIEVTLFSDAYEAFRDVLVSDRILVVMGTLNYDEYRGGMMIRADQVMEFEQARAAYAGSLKLSASATMLNDRQHSPKQFVDDLEQVCAPYQGGVCDLVLNYRGSTSSGTLVCGEAWKLRPTDELIRKLTRLLGPESVEVVYSPRSRMADNRSASGSSF
jgi:DNA polymerase-3 subunit alpha